MIFEASEFVFKPPSVVSRARRVLIKPCASYPVPYPVTTSPQVLAAIIAGIRRVSDADILILEGTPGGGPTQPIFQALGYNFPRVLMLDVKDSILVEVENPLPKPFAIPTFWVPNVILSSDYLITVSPLNATGASSSGSLSITNLLTLLPSSKYRGEEPGGWGTLYSLGIEKVLADLYFTLPFDLGIVETRQEFASEEMPGEMSSRDAIFVGEPYEVDSEVSQTLGLKTDYLELIKLAKVDLDT